jgi:exopolysaccharide biosynthesis polyprenyl glycosylphosphotransferase
MSHGSTPETEPHAAAAKQPGSDDVACYAGLHNEKMLLLAGDLLFICLVDVLSAYSLAGYWAVAFHPGIGTLAVTILLYPSLLYAFDLYNMERLFCWRDLVLRATYAAVLTGFLSGVILLTVVDVAQAQVAMLASVSLWVFLVVWRRYFKVIVRAAIPRIPAVIVATGPTRNLIEDLSSLPLFPYEIRGSLATWPSGAAGPPSGAERGGHIAELLRESGARRAILAIPASERHGVARDIVEARFRGTVIEEMASVYEQLTGRVPVDYIEDQWLFSADGFDLLHQAYLQRAKRTVDVVISILLLLLSLPLAIVATLLIKIDSRGPLFYRQNRVGKDGRVFSMFKFRSMRRDAEVSGIRWASERDDRITRVGKWLRLYHIDEIPQLLNVLKGDMSIIGPRPERPEFVRLLEAKVPYYNLRQSVRPGVTGWAQVTFRYGASLEDAARKLESDLYYIKNMSLFLDFKIMLRTIGIVFLADGSR